MNREQPPLDLLSSWINSLIESLDEFVEEDTKKKLLEKSGIACAHYHGHVDKIKVIKEKTKNLDEILNIMNQEEMWCGKWIKEGDIIYSKCRVCECPLVVSGMVRLSPTYCYCSQGYMKSVFGEILEKPFEVKLEKSIGKGDDVCLYSVKLKDQ